MKRFISLFMITGILIIISCKKHEIEYTTLPIAKDMAEFQLNYFVPIAAKAPNYITKVEINDQLLSNKSTLLLTYNTIPRGGVGRFYTTKIGYNNIKLYQGTKDAQKMVYNQNCNLKSGKQNIFIYDFLKPPIVFDNGFPYVTNVTENGDNTAWIKFYNFLYETEGSPTNLKLQYQYQYPIEYDDKGNVTIRSEWTNIGVPLVFGETTGWVPVTVNKSVKISSGYASLKYKIKVIDIKGNDLGDLMIINKNGNYINYSDSHITYVGRRYHHVISGFRATSPNSAVRQFTAL